VIPFNIVTPTRYGLMLASRFDEYVGTSLIEYGEFSQAEVESMARYIRPGDIVLDIGANIGALTVPLAHLVGPRGMVFAFEPQRLCFQSLCANVALCNLVNVTALNLAVGCEGDTITVPFLDPTKRANFGGVELGAPGLPVDLVRLDEMPKAALVKVDVEGMEAAVLQGGMTYLAEHRPVLYVESDRGNRRAELLALLDQAGYDCWWDRPPLYSPTNFRGNTVNLWPNITSENLLCLPRGGQWPPPENAPRAA
jgi:FkbM family methyltransferase